MLVESDIGFTNIKEYLDFKPFSPRAAKDADFFIYVAEKPPDHH
jgi:hypothetical protein